MSSAEAAHALIRVLLEATSDYSIDDECCPEILRQDSDLVIAEIEHWQTFGDVESKHEWG